MTGRARCKGTCRDGSPCPNWPVRGATVCRMHGGAAPQVKAKAAERVAVARAEAWLVANVADAPPMQSLADVYDELAAVAGQAAAWRKALAGRVAQLESLGYEGMTAEQVKADVQLFERAMDRSAKVCDQVARLNLDERRQAIAQGTADRFVTAVRGALAKTALPADVAEEFRANLVAELRSLTGGDTP